jgi:hypothetical protein
MRVLERLPPVPDVDIRAETILLGSMPFVIFLFLYVHFRYWGAFPFLQLFLRSIPCIATFFVWESIAGLMARPSSKHFQYGCF